LAGFGSLGLGNDYSQHTIFHGGFDLIDIRSSRKIDRSGKFSRISLPSVIPYFFENIYLSNEFSSGRGYTTIEDQNKFINCFSI